MLILLHYYIIEIFLTLVIQDENEFRVYRENFGGFSKEQIELGFDTIGMKFGYT